MLKCSVRATASCDEDVGDVGDVGENELEELVHRPGTTQSIFLPFLMRSGFGPLVQWKKTRDLRRVFRVKELQVYLREALLSPINPIP